MLFSIINTYKLLLLGLNGCYQSKITVLLRPRAYVSLLIYFKIVCFLL